MGRLHGLVRLARHEDVRAEIERGSDVNSLDPVLTPLEIAVHNGDVAMVDLLIRAGADVDHGHPKTGKRPLSDAVTQPDMRILELLLAAGADVEGRQETSTPLCIAAGFGKREVYDRLIEAGANPSATRNGKSASQLMESAADTFESIRLRFETEADNEKPDKYARLVEKMMTKYPNVEGYAAHHGRSIYIYGLDQGVFVDSVLATWARNLGTIIRSPERLEECEERFLSGDELDDARKERKKLLRWLARENSKKERIALAAEKIDG